LDEDELFAKNAAAALPAIIGTLYYRYQVINNKLVCMVHKFAQT